MTEEKPVILEKTFFVGRPWQVVTGWDKRSRRVKGQYSTKREATTVLKQYVKKGYTPYVDTGRRVVRLRLKK